MDDENGKTTGLTSQENQEFDQDINEDGNSYDKEDDEQQDNEQEDEITDDSTGRVINIQYLDRISRRLPNLFANDNDSNDSEDDKLGADENQTFIVALGTITLLGGLVLMYKIFKK